eukprot:CAMPEP_0197549184 /NCGR_PEP_ID=MMETSP1320-20131121/3146_1 /TAXON_ID=91990 /ORGANISM="Bolidomonas sp., Strain RCC2347" /LENGTH=43 /DNA_ID= /DNA_START= /DNA_END= /DNA_ORIENTATION=
MKLEKAARTADWTDDEKSMPAVEVDAERRAETEAGPTSWPSSG